MALHVVTTNALHNAAIAFLGNDNPLALPLSKVELAQVTGYTPTASETSLLHQVVNSLVSLNLPPGSDSVYRNAGNLTINVRDNRDAEVYSDKNAVGYYFDPPGAGTEFLGVIVVEDDPSGSPGNVLSKSANSSLEFSLGLIITGHQITGGTFTKVSPSQASEAETVGKTVEDVYISPKRLDYYRGQEIFPIAGHTIAGNRERP